MSFRRGGGSFGLGNLLSEALEAAVALEPLGAACEQRRHVVLHEDAKLVDESLLEGGRHELGIAVGAAERLGEHAVDEAELREARGRQGERLGGARGLAGVLEENGRAALGTDDRVGRVLKHHHGVGDGDRERAARAALANHAGDDRHVEGGHRVDVVADGLGLAALLGVDAGIGARGIDEGDDGQAELLGELHEAQGLPVALGTGHAEVAAGALAQRAALLVADHDDVHVGEAGETAHDRLVVRKGAVAVELLEVREHHVDVVERVRAVRMARDE